jgi:hypothetical protein
VLTRHQNIHRAQWQVGRNSKQIRRKKEKLNRNKNDDDKQNKHLNEKCTS